MFAGLFILAALGFLLSFWWLSALAVVVGGVLGRSIFALVLGLLLDFAWGTPTGSLQVVLFPLTLLALL